MRLQTSEVVVANGIFAGNTATQGGAIAVYEGTALSLVRDTIFFLNAASASGDDMYIYGEGASTTPVSKVECAQRGVFFCSGIDDNTIYQNITGSTDCTVSGVDSIESEAQEMCQEKLSQLFPLNRIGTLST
jgi:predicted outer membrane repeat protein